MAHDYSLAHLTVLSLTPPEVIEAAARAGYAYASLRMTRVTPDEPLYDLAHDRALMRDTRERMAATGIRVHDIELFRMDPTLEPETFEPQLDATAELGAQHIIGQLPDPDRARATDRFARMCDLAAARKLFVSLEFPHWTETGTLDEAARVVRAVQKPNAGILIDMLHMARSNSSVGHLAALPREWFPFVHVCDADARCPPTVPEMIRTARDERDFPGEGTIDIAAILGAMPNNIPYSLEIPRAILTKAVGPYEVARLALLAARAQLDGESRHANTAVSARSQTEHIRTATPQGRA